jgi:tyrosyl-tRNA synthetase
LVPKPQELKEMVIKPLKTLSQIREEREALAMRETRLVTGVDVLQSPITALYQTFSKKEKNKRWIAEQEFKDNKRKVVQELLRLYVASDIIELNEDEFDDFISFLSLSETFLKTSTEMELYLFIKDKYDHYKRIKN